MKKILFVIFSILIFVGAVIFQLKNKKYDFKDFSIINSVSEIPAKIIYNDVNLIYANLIFSSIID